VAATLLVIQLLGFATYQLDIWIGGALLSPRDLGMYGVAKRCMLLAQLPVQMAMYAIVATVPRLHAQGRTPDLEKLVRGAATWAAIPALGAIVALVLLPGPILHLVFSHSYDGAAPVILPLALGALALVLLGNPSYVLLMTGRQRLVLAVNGVSAVAMVAGASIGALWYGAVGLAAGSAASLALQNVLLWWLVRRELGLWTHVGIPAWPALSRSRTSEDNSPREPERLRGPLADGEPIPS
jgi:O-antigen/teichoic acid export membrane protein